MNTAAIFHSSTIPWSYPINENQLMIRLQTDVDVEKVFLRWGDPFEGGILGGNWDWTGTKTEITHTQQIGTILLWSIIIEPPYKRCRYQFELHQGNEIWHYGEKGACTVAQFENKEVASFYQPWMNKADIPTPPSWVGDTVWYQIFPDRFFRGTASPQEQGLTPWQPGEVTNDQRYGGNLPGITEKLDYLKDLGISGLYLNPIFSAASMHKYDTTDYYTVDPHFGTNKDLATLVQEAHKRNIKVMLDGVFNHCGPYFAPWLDVVPKGPQSPYWGWFMVHTWPLKDTWGSTKDGRYYSFAFHGGMPKFNTNNPQVIDYLCDLCVHWVKEYKIDGIRFDVGNEVSHRFLKAVRQRVHQISPDIYLIGEIWHNSVPWLLGDEYDSVMNYPLRTAVTEFFYDTTKTSRQLVWDIRRCLTMYCTQHNPAMFNLLDSHDTERLWNRTPNPDTFLQQLALLFTLPGSPCIYYGTELALPGGHDPDCRRCMEWNPSPTQQEMYKEIQALIALRNTNPELRTAEADIQEGDTDRCFIITRGNIRIWINASETQWSISLPKEILYHHGKSSHTFRSCTMKKSELEPGGILIGRI